MTKYFIICLVEYHETLHLRYPMSRTRLESSTSDKGSGIVTTRLLLAILWQPCNRYDAFHADRYSSYASICVIQQRLT
jgi:hypothetical protein